MSLNLNLSKFSLFLKIFEFQTKAMLFFLGDRRFRHDSRRSATDGNKSTTLILTDLREGGAEKLIISLQLLVRDVVCSTKMRFLRLRRPYRRRCRSRLVPRIPIHHTSCNNVFWIQQR